jgi:hypothetical protein
MSPSNRMCMRPRTTWIAAGLMLASLACGGSKGAISDDSPASEPTTAGRSSAAGRGGAGSPSAGVGGSSSVQGGAGASAALSSSLVRCLDRNALALEPAASLRELAAQVAVIRARCAPSGADLSLVAARLGREL